MPIDSRIVLLLAVVGLAACGTESRPHSVLLVTLDTTRADHIGCYGRADAGTPALDGLAARGVRFERAYTTVPVTLPAHATLLTGSYPPYHGVRDNVLFRLDDAAETLAETSRRAGHRTAAFLSGVPLSAIFGLDQGFDVYDEAFGSGGNRGRMLERPADRTVAAALEWFAGVGADEGFFLWVHLFDPHLPLTPPPEFARRFPERPYQAEISFADAEVGRLLEALQAAGRLEDTLVCVTADHGEGLGEHREGTHGNLLYDGTLRIPLLLAGPGVPAAVEVSAAVSLVDVAPTLVELAGIEDGGAYSLRGGLSLAGLWRDPGTFPDRDLYFETYYPRIHHGWSELVGIANGDWKYVEAPRTPGADDGPRAELFLVTDDPAEANDQAGKRSDLTSELAERLGILRAALNATALAVDLRAPTEVELADFAALGYGGADLLAIAEEDSEAEVARDPRLVVEGETLLTMVRSEANRGEFERADAFLARLIALDPGPVIVHEATGDLFLARGRRGESEAFEQAAEEYRAATELRPGRRGIWLRRSEALLELDRLAEALECVDRAMELSPPTEEQRAARADLARRAEAQGG